MLQELRLKFLRHSIELDLILPQVNDVILVWDKNLFQDVKDLTTLAVDSCLLNVEEMVWGFSTRMPASLERLIKLKEATVTVNVKSPNIGSFAFLILFVKPRVV